MTVVDELLLGSARLQMRIKPRAQQLWMKWFGDNIRRTWRQIQQFSPDAGEALPSEPDETPQVPFAQDDLPEAPVTADEEIIRDERGVRIARELDD